jgi:hypothetical protein
MRTYTSRFRKRPIHARSDRRRLPTVWWSQRSLRAKMGVVGLFMGLVVGVLLMIALLSRGDQATAPPKERLMSSTHKPDQTEIPPPAPLPPPSTSPIASTPPPPAPTPGRVLNLTNWKLTLPIDTPHAGTPDEITQPALASFTSDPYFRLVAGNSGVAFRAHAGGATTKNSNYPRTELREMTDNGKRNASWSNSTGMHTLTVRQAIVGVPVAKPEVVTAQIHDASDDVVMVRLEGRRLFVESDGDDIGLLTESYALGTVFTVKIVAANGRIAVFYNGEQKIDYVRSGSGFYFKAGCYTQSNTSKGDSADAFGEVVIYDLQVSHS